MSRPDARRPDQLRPVTITRASRPTRRAPCWSSSAAPACCARPACTEGVPRWRKGCGLGWVTAEYAMLPRATHTRNDRESVKGQIGGRTHEISRLIGRVAARLARPGGARREQHRHRLRRPRRPTAARAPPRSPAPTSRWPTPWLARRAQALAKPNALVQSRRRRSASASSTASRAWTSATRRTSRADTDMNVVCTGDGGFVEVQGTAEGRRSTAPTLDPLLDLAVAGCARARPSIQQRGARPLSRR